MNSVREISGLKEYFIDNEPALFEISIPERTPVLPDIAADKDALRHDGKLPVEVIAEIENLINEV